MPRPYFDVTSERAAIDPAGAWMIRADGAGAWWVWHITDDRADRIPVRCSGWPRAARLALLLAGDGAGDLLGGLADDALLAEDAAAVVASGGSADKIGDREQYEATLGESERRPLAEWLAVPKVG